MTRVASFTAVRCSFSVAWDLIVSFIVGAFSPAGGGREAR